MIKIGLLFQAMKGEFSAIRLYQFYYNCIDKRNTSYVVNFIPINCEIEVVSINEESRRKFISISLGSFEICILILKIFNIVIQIQNMK